MKYVINKNTRQCTNVFNDDAPWIDHGEFILSPTQGGNVGWFLDENDEWIVPPEPNPPPLSDEQKWDNIRRKRDLLLKNSDFAVLPDVPLSTIQKQEWIAYRQMLRDLPELYANPDDVIWPTAPQ